MSNNFFDDIENWWEDLDFDFEPTNTTDYGIDPPSFDTAPSDISSPNYSTVNDINFDQFSENYDPNAPQVVPNYDEDYSSVNDINYDLFSENSGESTEDYSIFDDFIESAQNEIYQRYFDDKTGTIKLKPIIGDIKTAYNIYKTYKAFDAENESQSSGSHGYTVCMQETGGNSSACSHLLPSGSSAYNINQPGQQNTGSSKSSGSVTPTTLGPTQESMVRINRNPLMVKPDYKEFLPRAKPGIEGIPINRANGGFINGRGTERSDSIPANLSNNEFVLTADAVRGAGNGNINTGARKLYALMDRLEGRG